MLEEKGVEEEKGGEGGGEGKRRGAVHHFHASITPRKHHHLKGSTSDDDNDGTSTITHRYQSTVHTIIITIIKSINTLTANLELRLPQRYHLLHRPPLSRGPRGYSVEAENIVYPRVTGRMERWVSLVVVPMQPGRSLRGTFRLTDIASAFLM
ncbi:hypothetical protein Pcinc_037608 [Petrolisthes cinctipes]|uniref:Uncharacterized protein n=1 Tax=Petrolisthes cinctipes TaxID=88211 RepID=A0AAE1BVE3_PETCI|nr:hypothetical protein Pcinc_037608 [Petrolisthes cinctipes]